MNLLRYFLGCVTGALLAVTVMLRLGKWEHNASPQTAPPLADSARSRSPQIERALKDTPVESAISTEYTLAQKPLMTPAERIILQKALNAEYGRIFSDPRLFLALHYQTQQQQKRGIATFAELLNLNAKQKLEMSNLLADRQLSYLENDVVVSTNGSSESNVTYLAGLAQLDDTRFNARLVEAIGAENVALYKIYRENQKRWKEASELRDTLAAEGGALTQPQIAYICDLTSSGSIFSEEIQTAMGAILTDQQRILLKNYATEHSQLKIADDIDKRLRKVIRQNSSLKIRND